MAKVTIEDISRRTGLSRGTVSRALNDRPDISQPTKDRVIQACRELNYVRSHAARSLATGRTFTVMVLLDHLESPTAVALLRGALAQAQANNYVIHVAELGHDDGVAAQYIASLAGRRDDGVLVAARLASEGWKALVEIAERQPLVSCVEVDGVECDILLSDHVESGRLAGRHLFAKDRQHALYVHAPAGSAAADRLTGFRETCGDRGVNPHDVLFELKGAAPSPAEADRLVEKFRTVDAVAASDDSLAVQLLALAARAGRHVGEDFALLGQGDTPLARAVTPPLTSIDDGAVEIGRRAITLILQRVSKSRLDAPETTRVAPTLIPRASTLPLQ
ncbi:Ribose operon repressor [Phycisphaerae bacterium RAS1]|nr:Ribose operon repressor [Phycisphaerae bacterium RAS1]